MRFSILIISLRILMSQLRPEQPCRNDYLKLGRKQVYLFFPRYDHSFKHSLFPVYRFLPLPFENCPGVIPVFCLNCLINTFTVKPKLQTSLFLKYYCTCVRKMQSLLNLDTCQRYFFESDALIIISNQKCGISVFFLLFTVGCASFALVRLSYSMNVQL